MVKKYRPKAKGEVVEVDVAKKHRSHISSRQTKSRGWFKPPTFKERLRTEHLAKLWQIENCTGCCYVDKTLLGTGRPCCLFEGIRKVENGKCKTGVRAK